MSFDRGVTRQGESKERPAGDLYLIQLVKNSMCCVGVLVFCDECDCWLILSPYRCLRPSHPAESGSVLLRMSCMIRELFWSIDEQRKVPKVLFGEFGHSNKVI
jgi:hypothetical protein